MYVYMSVIHLYASIVRVYVCMYVCICICIQIYIYIYTYILYTYIYIAGGSCGHWAGDQHGRELEQLLPRHNRQGTHFTCFTGTKL